MVAGPAQEGLQDTEGHATEGLGGLVAMYPLVKIGLGKSFHPVFFVDVDEVAGFHTVPDGEGDVMQEYGAARRTRRTRAE